MTDKELIRLLSGHARWLLTRDLPNTSQAVDRAIDRLHSLVEENEDLTLAHGECRKSMFAAFAEVSRLSARVAELEGDKARLDFLDEANERLNAKYGTTYRWRLIMNHNVNRLMIGHMDVDLEDSQPNGLKSCRDAIDERMRDILAARSLLLGTEGDGGLPGPTTTADAAREANASTLVTEQVKP